MLARHRGPSGSRTGSGGGPGGGRFLRRRRRRRRSGRYSWIFGPRPQPPPRGE